MDLKQETMSDLAQHSYFVLYLIACFSLTASKFKTKNGIILLQRGALEGFGGIYYIRFQGILF